MYGLSENKWLEWKRKRRNTLIGFVIIGTFGGIDCSVLVSTLYLYLRDLIKSDRPELWYGLITAFFFISSTIFGVFFGRWLDRTRRVRVYVNISLLVQVIGFLLYTISYHPIILLVGRTICGMGDPFTSVVTGEVFRIYDNEGSTRSMLWLASVYSFGFIIGPSLNFIFAGIDFNIGSLKINNLNFIGIFMAILLFIVLLIANFLVHDCSLEFDLKNHLKCNEDSDDKSSDETPGATVFSNSNTVPPIFVDKDLSQERPALQNHLKSNDTTHEVNCVADLPNETINKVDMSNVTYNNAVSPISSPDITKTIESTPKDVIPVKVVLINLLSNKDTLLIFVTTFIFVYSIFVASASLPLLATIYLKWNLKTISIMYACIGVADFLFLYAMGKYCKSNKSVYYTSLVAILSQIMTCALLICFKVLERNYERDISMIILYLISIMIGWCFDDVLIRVLLANLVPSNIQSFCEALRSGMCKIAMVVGSFTVGVVLPWVQWWSAVIILFSILLFIAFIIRGKHLINPKEISFLVNTPRQNIKVVYSTHVP